MVESSERSPLLKPQRHDEGERNEASYGGTTESSTIAEDHQNEQAELTTKIEAIKEALPMQMVLLSLGSLYSSLFVVAIDSSLLITLLNDISTDFSASDLVFWLGSSYTLAMCAVSPIYGRLNEIIGRKNAVISAVGIFFLGTMLCTIAPSMLTLIAARAIAGMGGGGISTCVAVILGDIIPLRKRGQYQAFGQLVFSLGNATGGPLGGLISDRVGWRLAIAIQLPILIVSLLLLIVCLRLPDLPKSKEEIERQERDCKTSIFTIIAKRLDITGSLLLVAACLTLMFGFSFISANDLPFTNIKVWSTFLASGVLAVCFVLVEIYYAKEPILPMSMFKNRTTASATAIYFAMCNAAGIFFYFPVYFRSVLLQSASETGVHLISMTVATTVGSFVNGAVMKKTGRYKTLLLFSCTSIIVTPLYIATWSDTNRPPKWAQNLVMIPFGFGGSGTNSILVVSVLAASSREDHAVSMGLLYLARSLGQIVGVSAFGAQIQHILSTQLHKRIIGKGSEEIIDKIRKNAGIVASLPPGQQLAAIKSYAITVRVLNACAVVVLVISLLIACFVKEYPLNSPKDVPTKATSPANDGDAAETAAEEP